MPAPLDCPALECWQALFGNLLPVAERERYERHLESCPICQARLDQPDEFGHLLRSRARRIGDPTAAPADPTLVEVLERLRHDMGGSARIAGVEPTDLYFLRPTDRPDLLGTLGEYEVQEVISQGGMGVVLKAFEPALNRLVAIKVLAASVAGSATARRRFTREARAAAAVCHDHVVAVHGVHEVDGLPYLVMQYVPGESLQDRLDRCGSLEVTEMVRIGLQTAQGLAAAHAQGLIHRDIKPANLLLERRASSLACPDEEGQAGSLSYDVRVKITDFGLARMVDDVGLTQHGVVAGTPEYMAPEQARAEPIDHRADLFSLGSVLYACCTGLPPFRANTTLAVLRAVCEQEPAPLRLLNPDVPAWLEDIVTRLLAKDPAGRFQSAAEVATLLEGYLNHLQEPSVMPVPQLPASARVIRCLPQRLGLAVLVLVVAVGVGFWWAGGREGDSGSSGHNPDLPTLGVKRSRSSLWLAGALVGLVCTFWLGMWLHARQRRRSGTTQEPIPATVPVPCPGCGKKLKARTGLIGKKLKCPGCGEPVVVAEPRHSEVSGQGNQWWAIRLAAGIVLATAAVTASWILLSGAGESDTREFDKTVEAVRALETDSLDVRPFPNITDRQLSRLRGLINLRRLNLDHSQITDEGLKEVAGLTRLVSLSLTNTQVSDAGLGELSPLVGLEDLRLDRLPITDTGLAHLKAFAQLRKLSLYQTSISDAGLVHLKELPYLERLSLDDTRVNDAGVSHLSQLSHLKYLSVWKTGVTANGIQELQAALPRLQVNR